MVCIFRNSYQIGTKFGTNQSYFLVNVVTYNLVKSILENKVAPSGE